MKFAENATVIVVHGAWADGSSWSEVHPAAGNAGVASHRSADSAYISQRRRRCIEAYPCADQGPVIVVGHAYAGAVIATAGDVA